MTTAPKVARKRQVSPTAAAGILAARDPVIARLLVDTGPPRLRRFPEPPFAAPVPRDSCTSSSPGRQRGRFMAG